MPNYWSKKKQIPRYEINGIASENPPRQKKGRGNKTNYYNNVFASLLQLLNKICKYETNMRKISIVHKIRNGKTFYKIMGEGYVYSY
ncbi:unnamed protein product, partial [marine sediment metagenome]